MEYNITLLKLKKTKEDVPGKNVRRDLSASAANVISAWISAWHAISHFILNEDVF